VVVVLPAVTDDPVGGLRVSKLTRITDDPSSFISQVEGANVVVPLLLVPIKVATGVEEDTNVLVPLMLVPIKVGTGVV